MDLMGLQGQKWSSRERVWAALVTGCVVGAALVPLRQYRRPTGERVDGFPLSYYPMFSARRGQFGSVSYAVGVYADGSRRNLPYNMLGPGGVNQVRKQLSRAVSRGQVEDYARRLAARVAEHPAGADVVRVEIVRGEFDLDATLIQRSLQGNETVLTGADVPGKSAESSGSATVEPARESA
jgi:hypothetical protein